MKHNAGFTLIELLVVLAILAALSLVALRSTVGLQDRTRFESTARALENAQNAILGSDNGSPGDIEGGGFLADMGRLPDFSNVDPAQRLIELWRAPSGVAANHLATDTDDLEVRLSCGWRGPYLRLPTGRDPSTTNALEDGWGFPITVRFDALASRWQLISPGSDDVLDAGSESAADIPLSLPSGIELAQLSGSVNVLHPPSSLPSWNVLVFAFEPDPTTGNLRVVQEDADTDALGAAATPATFHFNFVTNVLSPGPRLIRAYLFPAGSATPRVSAVQKSAALALVLLHGAQVVELTIDG